MLVSCSGKQISIGIIQGRLTPSRGRGIQFFPFENWQIEFLKAAELGLHGIEFVFDLERYKEHPLWSSAGRSEVRKLIDAYGVTVKHICADFFITRPFFRIDPDITRENIAILRELLNNSVEIGATNVEIPILGNSSLKTKDEENIFLDSVGECINLAEKLNLTISIESDLDPLRFASLISRFNSSTIGVVYDCGNSASYGYNCKEEISVLGPWIKNIHVKDKIKGGKSVFLGHGLVNFDDFFKSLELINYSNGFNLECARGDDFSEEKTVKNHLAFLMKYLKIS